VVLTVAHLDHTPENVDPANLKAWCQRCHLTFDAPLHARNAAATRAARSAG
jgi:5-methylcytosine-specific restriction endonuclease McrA